MITKLKLLIMVTVVMGFAFTGCMKDREPTAPTPIERPQITNNFNPSNGELKVKQNTSLKIFFTHSIDVNTLPNKFILENFEGDKIEGSYSVQDAAAIFTPAQPLEKSSIYKITLRGRVRDIYGNSIYHNGSPVLNDTTPILSASFYTEGEYSEGGFNRVYAADKSNVFVFDSLNCLVNTIKYSGVMTGYAVSEDGLYLLVSSGSTNSIDFINLQGNNIESSLSVSKNPQTLTARGNFIYAACSNGKAIEKINITSKSIEKTFILDFFPGEVTVSADGNKLFTIDQAKKDLVIIDAASGSVSKRIPNAVTSYAGGKIKTDETGRLYICDTKGNKLNIVGTDDNITTSVEFSDSPVNLGFDETSLFVASGLSVYKLEKQTFMPGKVITFPSSVKSVSVLPSGDILYAVTINSAAIIDIKTFTVLEEIELGSILLQEIISNPKKF